MTRTKSIALFLSTSILAFGLALAASDGSTAVSRSPLTNYGDVASEDRIDRTIVLKQDAICTNVTNGETVKFVVRKADGTDSTFVWGFNVFPTVNGLDMSKIAPAGLLDRDLYIHVAPDARSRG